MKSSIRNAFIFLAIGLAIISDLALAGSPEQMRPALAMKCDKVSGTSTVQAFSVQVYAERVGVILNASGIDRLLALPDVFNYFSLTEPYSFDGHLLTLKLNYATHTQYFWDIMLDVEAKTAKIVERDYYDIPEADEMLGDYQCTPVED